jgi:tRNA U34 5-carboxymethylaminomethyl modifying GTPase MnmE/TrmE
MTKMTPTEKLDHYSKEIAEDLKITEITLQDKSFDIPQRKHYWVAKLIIEKQELNRLKKEKKQIERSAMETQQAPVALSQNSMKKLINNTAVMQDIQQQIEDQELLVEYLEKTEKIFSYITNDVKNIVEIIQLQTL